MRLFWIGLIIIFTSLAACSDDKETGTGPDVIPPQNVQDLTFQCNLENMPILIWTAPGDDGNNGQAMEYDIRYSSSLLSEAVWDLGVILDSLRVPKPAGQMESLLVPPLADSTWYFGVKTADEVPNWSAMSNIVSVTILDTIPPSQVTSLEASFTTMASITLTWMTPGDDAGEGQASEYDLRYALEPITEDNWDNAFRIENLPVPGPAGTSESHTVQNLESGMIYCFALKTIDDSLNESVLSNAVNRSTAYIERLTISPDDPEELGAMWPIWSPDGLNIIFRADWGRDYHSSDLYIISIEGGQPRRLTYPDGIFEMVYGATWSPDGSQVAFVYERSFQREIYIMDVVPGAEVVQLTTFEGEISLHALAWSPDGSMLAFVGGPFPNPGSPGIYTMPSSGGNYIRRASGEGSWVSYLNWSLDGTQIFYMDNKDDRENYDIWSTRLNGEAPIQLTTDPSDDSYPALSPDGSQIAFISNRSGEYDIWLMSSTGTNLTQLTFDSAEERFPSWSPDGTRIAFSSAESGTRDINILVLE